MGDLRSAVMQGMVGDSAETYNSLKLLLDGLENQETRVRARVILDEVVNAADKFKHIEVVSIPIQEAAPWEKLTLIQLPSTFAPEEWSYTFYEGLNRYPKQNIIGKKVCEIGCGNGWISLALAVKTNLDTIYGVDINPKAIVLSKLNLFLNAFNCDGVERVLPTGESLFSRVVFAESNLLNYFEHNGITLDLITGCIPQVLSPDGNLDLSSVKENLSDQELYDLSNYAPSLGYIEDQFGLGLIAKALEQSIDVLKQSGRIILNLGGRPGSAVLESLFLRRGFSCKRLWQKKVWQASDTDISALVSIERASNHKFEFYTSLNSEVSINAETAQLLCENGGEVAHSLCVYEGKIEFPSQTKKIYSYLKSSSFGSFGDDIDLSLNDMGSLEEKVEFLGNLTEYLSVKDSFAYNHVRGFPEFRRELRDFFEFYYNFSVSEDSTMLFPSREEFIRSLVVTFDFKALFISNTYFSTDENSGPRHLLRDEMLRDKVFETPSDVETLCQLIANIKPTFVVTELSDKDIDSTTAIAALADSAKQANTHVFIDVSGAIELSSNLITKGVFRYLAENDISDHVSIIGGFVNNALYKDLSVCFMFSKNKAMLSSFTSAAELSYSRVPVIPQAYYQTILNDLNSFQLSEAVKRSTGKNQDDCRLSSNIPTKINLKQNAAEAFSHAAIAAESRAISASTIRLDYGENELGVSETFKRCVFEVFGKRELEFNGDSLQKLLEKRLKDRYKLLVCSDILLTYGVAAGYAALCYEASLASKVIIIPNGSYGMFSAAARYNGCDVIELESSEENGFCITATELNTCLKRLKSNGKDAIVYLQFPIVNPTGVLLDNETLHSLLNVIKSHKAEVIIDTTFDGLAHNHSDTAGMSANNGVCYDWLEDIDSYLIGGVSKEYAAGGLRVGFLLVSNPEKRNRLSRVCSKPHATSLAVFQRLLQRDNLADTDLVAKLEEQRLILRKHCEQLSSLLSGFGWSVLVPKGGLFLVAKPPEKYLGQDLTTILFEKSDVLINSPEWTGLEDYYRFVLSIPSNTFKQALIRLESALKTME